jgi:hypothetical protein
MIDEYRGSFISDKGPLTVREHVPEASIALNLARTTEENLDRGVIGSLLPPTLEGEPLGVWRPSHQANILCSSHR